MSEPYTFAMMQDEIEMYRGEKLTTIDTNQSWYESKNFSEEGYRLQWVNKLAIVRFYQIIEATNRPADCVDIKPGGLAVWRDVPSFTTDERGNPVGIWEKWIINDKMYIHTKPSPHIDFWFMTLKLDIPADKRKNITDISNSFTYYEVGSEFTAGCHFYQASVVSAVVTKMYAEGKISLLEARRQYDAYIKELIVEWNNSEKGKDISDVGPMTQIFERYMFGWKSEDSENYEEIYYLSSDEENDENIRDTSIIEISKNKGSNPKLPRIE